MKTLNYLSTLLLTLLILTSCEKEDDLLAQIASTPQETVGGGATEFRLTFEKSSSEKIVITLTGLAINDHGVSGLEPVEPVFEDISWTAKTISVVATSAATAEQ